MLSAKKHKAAQAAERLVPGEAWADPSLVFTTTIGTPLGKSALIRRSFKPILRKAGLPDIRFHDLRHTCASVLLAAGENVSTTAVTYAHTLPDQHRQAAETMDRVLGRVTDA